MFRGHREYKDWGRREGQQAATLNYTYGFTTWNKLRNNSRKTPGSPENIKKPDFFKSGEM